MKNIALIGAGSIGQIHARNLADSGFARLAVICDVKRDAADALAAPYGAKAVSSIDDVLAKDIDGLIIASSTASHGDIARACIGAKKPFLCEKPLASDLATAKAIVSGARDAGLVAATAFNRRFDAGYSSIRSAVVNGQIGQIETLHMTSRTASPPTVEFTKTSGGLFGEKGSHFYDLARWITGEHPVEVFAMGSALINPDFKDIGEVDTALISMRMPSDILCQLDFSWRAAYGQDERLEVNGSLGMLQTKQEPVGRCVMSAQSGQQQLGLFPTWYERFRQTYAAELDLFLNAIDSGDASTLPSLADGLAAQQIAEAAKKSVRERCPVALEPL